MAVVLTTLNWKGNKKSSIKPPLLDLTGLETARARSGESKVAIEKTKKELSPYSEQNIGNLIPKYRLSAGKKQLLVIAFLWGLARVCGRKLPVVIDTVLLRLDSEHRSNLVERYFPAASQQVILLSPSIQIVCNRFTLFPVS